MIIELKISLQSVELCCQYYELTKRDTKVKMSYKIMESKQLIPLFL